MRFSRVDRKLLLALTAVAFMPMIAALFLGQAALLEAYQVGVNRRVGAQLEEGLSLYRDHFEALRRNAELIVDGIAKDHRLFVAMGTGDEAQLKATLGETLERYPELARLAVMRDDQEQVEVSRAGKAQGQQHMLTLTRALPSESTKATLEAQLFAPEATLRAYNAAGELMSVYGQLERSQNAVSNYYLLVYMGFLLSVIAVAVSVGLGISRRVTRRVALLAEATARVGAGDLSVQVPTSARDEIAELTHAFNAMVRDIRESRDRIEYLQRLGAWQEFARRLAHEIKNPLTPIQLAVQEIHRSYSGQDARYRKSLDDALAIVEEEVATLRRLVGEFSDFARLPRASLESADLGGFLADISHAVAALPERVTAEGKAPAAQVRIKSPETTLPVRIDAMMLRRCVENLVRNALQALRDQAPGAAAGLVEVEAGRDKEGLWLSVSDNGPGVSPADRERIFDPYVTTKSDGTGLGLAIVKKVVFEHGGEIRCEGRPGGGARFVIRLPAAD